MFFQPPAPFQFDNVSGLQKGSHPPPCPAPHEAGMTPNRFRERVKDGAAFTMLAHAQADRLRLEVH